MRRCGQCHKARRLHWAVPLCSRCIKWNRFKVSVSDLVRGDADKRYAVGLVIFTLAILCSCIVLLASALDGRQ
jgi:hypothetical protein